jgi:hypothetical protein
MVKKTKKIEFHAILDKAIVRHRFTFFKKGEVAFKLSKKEFKKLTPNNIKKYTNIKIVVGHGVYEEFELEKDISFLKVETTIIKKTTSVKPFIKKQ